MKILRTFSARIFHVHCKDILRTFCQYSMNILSWASEDSKILRFSEEDDGKNRRLQMQNSFGKNARAAFLRPVHQITQIKSIFIRAVFIRRLFTRQTRRKLLSHRWYWHFDLRGKFVLILSYFICDVIRILIYAGDWLVTFPPAVSENWE